MSKYKIYSLIAGLLFTVSYAPTSTAQTSPPPKQVNPIKRSAPTMPSGVQESGYCCISYNVSAKGKPVDIVAPYCTSPVFQKSAVKAVKKWRYKKSKEIKSGEIKLIRLLFSSQRM